MHLDRRTCRITIPLRPSGARRQPQPPNSPKGEMRTARTETISATGMVVRGHPITARASMPSGVTRTRNDVVAASANPTTSATRAETQAIGVRVTTMITASATSPSSTSSRKTRAPVGMVVVPTHTTRSPSPTRTSCRGVRAAPGIARTRGCTNHAIAPTPSRAAKASPITPAMPGTSPAGGRSRWIAREPRQITATNADMPAAVAPSSRAVAPQCAPTATSVVMVRSTGMPRPTPRSTHR